ncbi:mechanosensitive ion channel family protein [Paracoccus sp. JM45]|uniref:mechanosensitive ion channel family protein n=1 Tax=Paracoccus sp. JM45 TaxID=2283626 RepID=UPI000E6B64E2|nr:mechanosensitive ion channel domain-containing protein [Paracoccus sp. JM45]RJE79728.1 mechanosensitive ion channel family protein [Paracoccus sp. JM45]
MDQTFIDQLVTLGQYLLAQGQILVANLLRPWNTYQVIIALVLLVMAHILRAVFGPRLRQWMQSREGWPMWRLRVLVLAYRRLRSIFFVILVWITVSIMQQVTWPSRSYLLLSLCNLTFAWLIIAFATRLIANPLLRRAVRWAALIWVTLRLLGLTGNMARFLDQLAIEMGEIRISALMALHMVTTLVVFFLIAKFLSRWLSARIAASENLSPSMRVLSVKLLQTALFILAFIIGLRAIGVDLTALAFLSGAIGLGIGFGLQKVVSNLVSGVIILMDKSIKPGDVISIGETFGWINHLGARYASISTRDGREYLIPNEDLITGQVVNWSHSDEFVRLDIHFGTSYADDPHLVRRIATEAALTDDRVLSTRPPVCHITGFGDSSVDYVLRFWIKDPTGGLTNIRGKVFLALWDTFKVHNVSIPFPQREVRLLDRQSGHPA